MDTARRVLGHASSVLARCLVSQYGTTLLLVGVLALAWCAAVQLDAGASPQRATHTAGAGCGNGVVVLSADRTTVAYRSPAGCP